MDEHIIFRLQDNTSDLKNDIKHWQNSEQYEGKKIESIQSSNPQSLKEPTSIPSPFARIALAKTAFRIVASNWEDAPKAYQKIVSDCLDVAEILFNYHKFQDKIQIIVWDRERDLAELRTSDQHKNFGDTLKMYLEEDSKGKDLFNFSKLQRLYLLNYIGPDRPAQLNIIGATSPATLFFSVANDLSYVSKNIFFGSDKPFDDTFQPLYKRDFNFQKYLYAFRASYPNFAKDFPEVEKYLNSDSGGKSNYSYLSDSQKKAIDQLNADSINEYQILKIDNGANVVEILGQPLHFTEGGEVQSDFTINSTFSDVIKPLVLPIETGNSYIKLRYTQDNWQTDFKAPVMDPIPWMERTLPFLHDKFPYLTISDFMEESIIRMPKLLTESYFNGNIKSKEAVSYLLPLTDLFFHFFTTEDARKLIELKPNAGGITVKLSIPVQKNKFIEYSRNYYENSSSKIDESNNDGAIVERDFVFGLFPNIKFSADEAANYRFGLVSNFKESKNYNAKYYGKDAKSCDSIIRNESFNEHKQCKTYVLEHSNFDYIRLFIENKISGVIVPEFHQQGGTDEFTFSIDLGTTNTHIEYRVGDKGMSIPLDISSDKQINSSSAVGSDNYIFDFDYLPERIGDSEEFMFPIRTSLSESKNINWNSALPFADTNIPFPYEKRNEYKYNRIRTGLKWSNDPNGVNRISSYIQNLMLILRNKVILNSGDLYKAKIIWFYPISMTRDRYTKFKEAWEKSYVKYFLGLKQTDEYSEDIINAIKNNIIPITESIAPYNFFKKQVGNANIMVSVDIGGGTSDIVIANKDKVEFISSFRFAADSVFGDGYAENSINGIVNQFKEIMAGKLREEQLVDLLNIYETLNSNNISSDIASFFFSLKYNKAIKEKNLADSVDFGHMLNNDESQKIVFIIFYVAIIYHLAHLMLGKKVDPPRHITFSGNGSKIIQIITKDLKLLEELTVSIFEKIYGKKYNADGLTILQEQANPKKATCKGGIVNSVPQDYLSNENLKVILKNTDDRSFINSESYKDMLKEKLVDELENEARKFISFVFDLNKDFPFKNNFGVSNKSLQIAKAHCLKDLKTYISNGIIQKKKETSPEDPIEETFFFYALNGMLPALSEAIRLHKDDQQVMEGFSEKDLFQ